MVFAGIQPLNENLFFRKTFTSTQRPLASRTRTFCPLFSVNNESDIGEGSSRTITVLAMITPSVPSAWARIPEKRIRSKSKKSLFTVPGQLYHTLKGLEILMRRKSDEVYRLKRRL